MGGKKKKSSAQAPAVALAAGERRNGAAAAGTGSGEEPTRQTATNKTQKPSKENKSKGGCFWKPIN